MQYNDLNNIGNSIYMPEIQHNPEMQPFNYINYEGCQYTELYPVSSLNSTYAHNIDCIAQPNIYTMSYPSMSSASMSSASMIHASMSSASMNHPSIISENTDSSSMNLISLESIKIPSPLTTKASFDEDTTVEIQQRSKEEIIKRANKRIMDDGYERKMQLWRQKIVKMNRAKDKISEYAQSSSQIISNIERVNSEDIDKANEIRLSSQDPEYEKVISRYYSFDHAVKKIYQEYEDSEDIASAVLSLFHADYIINDIDQRRHFLFSDSKAIDVDTTIFFKIKKRIYLIYTKTYKLHPYTPRATSDGIKIHTLGSTDIESASISYDLLFINSQLENLAYKRRFNICLTAQDKEELNFLPICIYGLMYKMGRYIEEGKKNSFINFDTDKWHLWINSNAFTDISYIYQGLIFLNASIIKERINSILDKMKNVSFPMIIDDESCVRRPEGFDNNDFATSSAEDRTRESLIKKDDSLSQELISTIDNENQNNKVDNVSREKEDFVLKLTGCSKETIKSFIKDKIANPAQSRTVQRLNERANTIQKKVNMNIFSLRAHRENNLVMRTIYMTDHYGNYLKVRRTKESKRKKIITRFHPVRDDIFVIIFYDLFNTVHEINELYSSLRSRVAKYYPLTELNNEESVIQFLQERNLITENELKLIYEDEEIIQQCYQRLHNEWTARKNRLGFHTLKMWLEEESVLGVSMLINPKMKEEFQSLLSLRNKMENIAISEYENNEINTDQIIDELRKTSYMQKLQRQAGSNEYGLTIKTLNDYLTNDSFYLNNLGFNYYQHYNHLLSPKNEIINIGKMRHALDIEYHYDNTDVATSVPSTDIATYAHKIAYYFFVINWSIEAISRLQNSIKMHQVWNDQALNIDLEERKTKYASLISDALVRVHNYYIKGGWGARFCCPNSFFLIREKMNISWIEQNLNSLISKEFYQNNFESIMNKLHSYFEDKESKHIVQMCKRCTAIAHHTNKTVRFYLSGKRRREQESDIAHKTLSIVENS